MNKYEEYLEELECKKLQEKAIFLYKKGCSSEFGALNDFNVEEYEDVTYKNGFKGFNLYKKGEELVFASLIDEEGSQEAYQGVILENVSDEDYLVLKKELSKKPVVLKSLFITLLAFAAIYVGFFLYILIFAGVNGGFSYVMSYFCDYSAPLFIVIASVFFMIRKRK